MNDPGHAPRPLPPRPPRSFLVHWAVDSAIAFLVVLLPVLFLSASVWVAVVIGVVVGWLVTPWSRRAEARGLAEREARYRGEEPPSPN